MLVENQLVKTKWTPRTKKHYESLGYDFTGFNQELVVQVKDLSVGSSVPVLVECDECHRQYMRSYKDYNKSIHAANAHGKMQCYQCSRRIITENRNIAISSHKHEIQYKRAVEACKKNGYLLITPMDQLDNVECRVDYLCSQHGIQSMRLDNLFSGKKCPRCAADRSRQRCKLTTDDVIDRIAAYGGNVLNPEEQVNQTKKNLRIICPSCGRAFTSSLRNFCQHGGQICQDCQRVGSLGEILIANYLTSRGVYYIREQVFSDCRDRRPLPFDFYLPAYNTVIEFDGRQHYSDSNQRWFSHDSLAMTQKHDKIKTHYCTKQSINLIRIPFWSIDKITEIIDKQLHEDIV